jgi:hypothetical protein
VLRSTVSTSLEKISRDYRFDQTNAEPSNLVHGSLGNGTRFSAHSNPDRHRQYPEAVATKARQQEWPDSNGDAHVLEKNSAPSNWPSGATGGEATRARDRFSGLSQNQRAALIAYLNTL